MNKHYQQGRTLIEMMIAIFIGLMLTTGILFIFVSNQRTYDLQDGLARLQENGRYAAHMMSREIRMAGFQGCSAQHSLVPNNLISNPSPDAVFTDADIVTGYEAVSATTWSPALPAALVGNVAPGTDVITIRKGTATSIKLRNPMQNPNNPLVVENRLNIAAGDFVIITDCNVADLFVAGSNTNASAITHTVTNNISNNLSKAYSDARIMRLESYTFYIKDTGRTNTNGLAILALYRRDVSGTEQELVEGVQNLQVQYGVDTADDYSVDTFSTANTVNTNNNWPNVMSVRVSLLLNTIEEVSNKVLPYTFNGTTVSNPGNRLMHRGWESYITVRNRIL